MKISLLFKSVVLILSVLGAFSVKAESNLPNLENRKYSYASIGQTLSSLLEEWAEEMGIEMSISDRLNRRIWITFKDGNGKDFFLKIAKEQNLSWLYYGNKLYVYAKQEERKEIIRLNHISPSDFKEQLKQLEIFQSRFIWKTSPNIFIVIGPPKYVELIKEVGSFLDNQDTLVIKVFPLKYSWVQDRSIVVRQDKTIVPGIATILTRLFFTPRGEPPEEPTSMLKMIGSALPGRANIKPAQGAFIQADTQRNALIIRDYSRNIPLYQSVIETLDRPTPLVEITMTILDTSVEDEISLGMEWPEQLSFQLDLSSSKPFIMKTDKIDLTLHMLQSRGDVSVVSEPVLITMDNMEAVMDHSDTLHIRVVSEKNAKLVPVSSGTMLRVTPHVISEENGEKFIKLFLNIQDGSFGKQSSEVDGIPRQQNSSISTQARVRLDESLIIGGYYKETVQEEVNGIPFLSQIPILGRLFAKNTQNFYKTKRLFVITPRIVESEDFQ